MSELTARDYEWMFSHLVDPNDRKQKNARQMRGEDLPEWFVAAFEGMALAGRDPTFKESGEKHSVESMTEELRKRVQLDVIKKEASLEPPLFVKANAPKQRVYVQNVEDSSSKADAQKTLLEMKDYVERHFLRPGHGQASIPALFEAIKDKFDIDGVSKAGGIEQVKKMLEKLRIQYQEPNLAETLPTYDGAPQQLGHGLDNSQKDRSDFLGGGPAQNGT